MAFGIPGSEPSGGGEFLSRIQYDTRVGFWQLVRRVQDATGNWVDEKSEQFKNPTMLMDFGDLHVGFIKFSSPPAFLLVPYGQPIPPRPGEMMQDTNGKQRHSFLPGFRIKVWAPKLFEDKNAWYFAHNAKTVLDPMDELHTAYEQFPDAKAGQVPLVEVSGTRRVEIKTPQGTNTYHAPIFHITAWYDRPAAFGERTVPVPGGAIAQKPAAPVVLAPAPQIPLSRMSNGQTGAMARASVPLSNTTMRSNFPKAPQPLPADMRGGSTGNIIDDEIPFSACR